MTRSVVISINSAWNIVNFRASLIDALIAHGYDIVVVAAPDAYAAQIPRKSCRFIPIAMDNGGTNPFLDGKLLVDYYRVLSQVRPQCFLGYTVKPNVYGSLASHLLGIPTISNVAGLGTAFISPSWITFVSKALYRMAFSRASRVFFQNNDDLEYFVSRHLVNAAIASRIPGSGVDTDRFAPRATPRRVGRFRFLLLGRLLWEKGIREYVEAARIMKENNQDVEFYLLGFLDVANRAAIPRSQVEHWEAEGLITYAGSADDVIPFIVEADCVVLPSYREGAPRALLEAASMAKPIITTDVPGCRDVVDDGVTGFLAQVRDPVDLARKMESMLALPEEERLWMGQRGREKMQQEFDEQIVIQQYLAAIDSVSRRQ
ncbi:MAG: glycosyltransferase family 4 protein [Acidobacteriota bacterium]